MKRLCYLLVLLIGLCLPSRASAERLLIQMDLEQRDHLRAYGLAFWSLERSVSIDWLLNYRGGSFMLDYHDLIAREAQIRGVSATVITEAQAASILAEIDAIGRAHV